MRIFSYINLCLLITCACSISFFSWIFMHPKENTLSFHVQPKEYTPYHKRLVIPKHTLIAYTKGPLTLAEAAYTLTLPDLRNEIIYYGKNMRPDVQEEHPLYFIGLEGQTEIATIGENEPLYLKYLPSEEIDLAGEKRGFYSFSADNMPTALWIEMRALGTAYAEIHLSLLDENQREVVTDAELSTFRLPVKQARSAQDWQLGKHRVDSTLLVRQKARFIGEDLFLQMHGGEEYSTFAGASRLDFLEGTEPYSCFIRPGDFLIWDEERWRHSYETESHGKPLLVIQKFDERMLSCELWDELGCKKLNLNVIRLKDHYGLPDVQADFHFIQAKTWAQFIVECRGKKITLRPNDWLLLTEEGWEKIDSIEKVENYVNQTLTGPLLVIGKLKKEEGGQVLSGHLFNATRSHYTDVKLEQKKTTTPPVINAVRSLTQKTLSSPIQAHPYTRGSYHEQN